MQVYASLLSPHWSWRVYIGFFKNDLVWCRGIWIVFVLTTGELLPSRSCVRVVPCGRYMNVFFGAGSFFVCEIIEYTAIWIAWKCPVGVAVPAGAVPRGLCSASWWSAHGACPRCCRTCLGAAIGPAPKTCHPLLWRFLLCRRHGAGHPANATPSRMTPGIACKAVVARPSRSSRLAITFLVRSWTDACLLWGFFDAFVWCGVCSVTMRAFKYVLAVADWFFAAFTRRFEVTWLVYRDEILRFWELFTHPIFLNFNSLKLVFYCMFWRQEKNLFTIKSNLFAQVSRLIDWITE